MTDHEDRREGDHADGVAAPFLMGGGVVAEVIELVERRSTAEPTENEDDPVDVGTILAEEAPAEDEADGRAADGLEANDVATAEPAPPVPAALVLAPPAPPTPSALRPSAPRPVMLPGDDATVTRRMRATLSLVMVIVLAAGLAALLVAVAVVALVVALRRVAG